MKVKRTDCRINASHLIVNQNKKLQIRENSLMACFSLSKLKFQAVMLKRRSMVQNAAVAPME